MIIVLNGPIGTGKSTLAEALSESIDSCVMLDGDHVVAANPPFHDEVEHLHSTLALLVRQHRTFGYRHFVIDHLWTSEQQLDDLRRRLGEVYADAPVHCFRLTLPAAENLARIRRRARARALDELEFELRTMNAERAALEQHPGAALGEPFDVSATPEELVRVLLRRIGYADPEAVRPSQPEAPQSE